jgi:hypothetical protein
MWAMMHRLKITAAVRMRLRTPRAGVVNCLHGWLLTIVLATTSGGCQTGRVEAEAQDRFTVCESSTDPSQLKAVAVWTGVQVLPAPGRYTILLVDPSFAGNKSAAELQRLQVDGPSWRVLEGAQPNLVEVVRAMTTDVPGDRVRWVVANNPPVVAIGHVPVPGPPPVETVRGRAFIEAGRLLLPDNIRLITQVDLDAAVDEVRSLPSWPNSQTASTLQGTPADRVPLAGPQTIRQVLDSRPWVKPR